MFDAPSDLPDIDGMLLMAILNAMLSGGQRMPADYYPTPASATRALLPYIAHFPRPIWEPACGDGAISRVLNAQGIATIDQDLHDYHFGQSGKCFFREVERPCDSLVTNPPFEHAEDFIRHAHKLGVTHMALLLKSNYWSAARRIRLFELWRPSRILALTWRLDFTGAGAPHTDCIWVLWEGQSTQTSFDLLTHP